MYKIDWFLSSYCSWPPFSWYIIRILQKSFLLQTKHLHLNINFEREQIQYAHARNEKLNTLLREKKLNISLLNVQFEHNSWRDRSKKMLF